MTDVSSISKSSIPSPGAISAMIERFRHGAPKSREERLSSPDTKELHERFWWMNKPESTTTPSSAPQSRTAGASDTSVTMASLPSIPALPSLTSSSSFSSSARPGLLRDSTDISASFSSSVSSSVSSARPLGVRDSLDERASKALQLRFVPSRVH